MIIIDLSQALVTEPPLMALVCFAGLAMGLALALFVIDMNGNIRERER